MEHPPRKRELRVLNIWKNLPELVYNAVTTLKSRLNYNILRMFSVF